ncbi:MAG: adenylate/guanylate cyclase domain-containing protein [Candidatus Kapabacteria bacterium]|nr:adenylate/guanylate cyclase domain-containing protein [Candidatus Kapabacteria bacterium]
MNKANQLTYERKNAEREKQLAVERAKHEATEQLLYNVLPPVVAQKIIAGDTVIAERLEYVSVLFADIVNFTVLSQTIQPEVLVKGLDSLFTEFDTLAEQYGLEKIKTIGDAYMCAAGAPGKRDDDAYVISKMANAMLHTVSLTNAFGNEVTVQLRIGIHVGDVVAGVIGKKKFAYDLWGDAVNTASRMESYGESNKIHVTEEFAQRLQHQMNEVNSTEFTIKHRGNFDVKGKGTMKTYFVEGLWR